MTLKYLLDTNVISEPLRPAPNRPLVERLQKHQTEVAIPAVVWHELWFGCYRLPPCARRSAIEAYLNDVVAPTLPVLPYTAQAAEWHAHERARLVSIGKTPSFADGQIIAIAKTNELILVTLNTSDFAAFEGVQVQDWQS